VHLRSMLRMTIRVLSASDAFAPLSDPERTHTEFAYWMSGALEGIPPSFPPITMTGLERLTT
jgi:hypothetical protein